jgi:hypothetical protein
MPTDKQLEANRENARLSTGPTSSEGKAKVSHNALKTGLTGRTILLPSDDVTAYQAHVARTFQQFSPEGDDERRLAQSLADTLWRLDRIPALEAGIYAIGRRALAHEFADESDEAVRNALIEAQVFLTYRRDLSNLGLQETRLRRQYEKDEAELKRLVAERAAAAKKRETDQKRRLSQAVQHYKTAQECGVAFDPAEIGFEFSIEQVKAHVLQEQIDATISNGRYYEWKSKGYFKRVA